MARANQPSVTFTALIWLGMLLMLAGAAVAVLGVGAAVEFKAKIGGNEITTTSLGLAIMATGAVVAAYVATKLPKGVTVFAVHEPTWQDRVADKSGWLVAIAAIILVLLALSVWQPWRGSA